MNIKFVSLFLVTLAYATNAAPMAQTPRKAAKDNNVAELIRLFETKQFKVDDLNCYKDTALHCAANFGSLECVVELLKRDANVNAQDNYGWTPLHYAASKGFFNCVNTLLDNGAEINKKTFAAGLTPLYLSVMYNHLDCVKALGERGANTQAKANDGETPVMRAHKEGYHDIVNYLNQKQAKQTEQKYQEVLDDSGNITIE